MKIIKSVKQMQAWRDRVRLSHSVGFVPTMGALHRGHLALVNRSKREADLTVVSIFVNPIQFGPKEDFKKYPRPFRRDVAQLKAARVDVLFAPTAPALYPAPFLTKIHVAGLSEVLCGAPHRRGHGHFDGVATVVAKLFGAVRPTRAYFGMKDFQQLRVIEQMCLDLNFPVRIVRCPTVREPDGLALSSRNAYLSSVERSLAARIHFSLQQGRKLLTFSRMTPPQVRRRIQTQLTSIPNSQLEYIELVDPATLTRIRSRRGPVLIAVALRLGTTRLIDNVLVS